MSLGLGLWSGMTMLSGMAGNFAQLGAARIGVGVGGDGGIALGHVRAAGLFSKRQQAAALAIYSSSIYLGMGASLVLGGRIVAWWRAPYSHRSAVRPRGLAGHLSAGRRARRAAGDPLLGDGARACARALPTACPP